MATKGKPRLASTADAAAPSQDDIGVEARVVAGILLNAALEKRNGLDEALSQPPARALAPVDRAFARAVAMAALRRLGEIDQILDRRLQKSPPEAVRTLMRIALAQTLVLETPAFAAVSTAVKLAERDPKTRPYKNLVNAVLRGVGRDGPGLTTAESNLPDWIAARWKAAYGETALVGLALAAREEPATDLSLKPGVDPAAVARLLDVKAGETALDMCAAPGGKTLQLAAAGASVVALDRSAARLKRLKQNLERTGLTAEVVAVPAEDWADVRTFDAVLLDAPCTATGTFRRNPEVLRATRPAEIAKLADVQHRLLDAAAARVKPGGRLVYCTCSLEREEGETQIIAFLRRNPAFRTTPADPAALGAPPEALTPEGWLRILPSMWAEKGGLDGFFAARLERVS
ncbi:RsmB/NOP family class I SAM-dependent RNA methyltransferase [Brevundimonas sp.]|uniref:RsmB/NOP family class I SAM-dependent RNA methyltransferase n=1 Tax=Brevundimonas sp. TaxID=1871086 RepID=UPI0028A5B617|nr:RsmB/NOP family class I SAM-dependent RNA methyltransferase [Brevundimonas sp.]